MYDMSLNPKNLKKQRTEGVSTRSSNKKAMINRRPKTERYKKSLAYLGPKIWNNLPENMHHIATKAEFKKLSKIHVERRVALNESRIAAPIPE